MEPQSMQMLWRCKTIRKPTSQIKHQSALIISCTLTFKSLGVQSHPTFMTTVHHRENTILVTERGIRNNISEETIVLRTGQQLLPPAP